MRSPFLYAVSGVTLLALSLPSPLAAQRRGTQEQQKPAPLTPIQLDEATLGLFDWQSIGPANMGGRITDLAVYEADPTIWYVATATGGLLKTTNAGQTFEHQFEHEATSSIGAVAVSATDSNLVWVGTGEENPRNSVSYGAGVYKSTDGGETFTNMGLEESFQIGSIAIHPSDPDTVFVGALGRLYGPSEQRGLYKTTDGGESWEKVLHIDEETGVLEIAMHPTNPAVILVATYERQRDGFDTNDPAKKWGEGSGLYRSTNGGNTFTEVREGLPSGTLGRIGLHWYRKDSNVVYALVESDKIGLAGEGLGYSGIETNDAETGAKISDVADESPGAIAELQEEDIVLSVDGETVLSSDDFQERMATQMAGATVELQVARKNDDGERESITVSLTLTDQPEDEDRPYGTRLGGQVANIHKRQGPNGHEHGGLYRSDDQGESWSRVNSINPRPMYFSQVRVDPTDESNLYVLGISMARSKDQGESFTSDASRGVHSDQHAMWIDPKDSRHMLLGSDGGLYETFDRCDTWRHLNTAALGQFYHVTTGPRRDYWVYGGLQDNGSWGAPRRSKRSGGTINEEWVRIGGGDGFVCRVDENDPNQIYYESQNGGLGRTHLVTMEGGSNRPRGGDYRWNWRTPFILSHHNSQIFYTAGNHVFRSLQKGSDAKAISPDITRTERGSATALSESPRDADVLYVGTDDGALWMTKDGGAVWDNLMEVNVSDVPEFSTEEASASRESDETPATVVEVVEAVATAEIQFDDFGTPDQINVADTDEAPTSLPLADLIPGPRWVSSLETSKFVDGRVYLTLDAHRSDDDNPYVFVSEDYGQSWSSLAANLPRGSTRCVREDLENENLLYLGTEFGLYVSLDRGLSWNRFHGGKDLPTVPIHEVAQHEGGSGEIVLGTHGRSLWVCDVSQLRQMTPDALQRNVALFQPNAVVRWRRQHGRGNSGGTSRFSGNNPDGDAEIVFRLAAAAASTTLEILDATGKSIRTLEAPTEAGVHSVSWNLRGSAGAIDPQRLANLSERFGRERALRFLRGRAPAVSTGTYRVRLTVDDQVEERSFEVQSDPNFPASDGRAELLAEFQMWEMEQGEEEENDSDDR
ncbi:MAG: PDZ domain-containing protein [Planctomycetota bacterium]